MTYTNERMKRATLRAVKAESIEGFPQADCGNGWWVEAHGMRASDVADCGLTSENVAILFAAAPKMLADLAVAREMLDAKDAEIAAMAKTLAERDALCEQQARTIHGIPALMRERDAEKARADAAEQMVCELRGVLRYYATRDFDSRGYSDSQLQAPADAALARTEPVAGRWVSHDVHERVKETWRKRHAELAAERDAAHAAKEAAESALATCRRNLDAARDDHDADAKQLRAAKEAAEARANEAEEHLKIVAADENSGLAVVARVKPMIEALKARADAAESSEHALGVQLVALQKRLALANKVLAPMGQYIRMVKAGEDHGKCLAVLEVCLANFAALDAVPGDALAVPVVDHLEAAYAGEDEVTP